jgi:hypothetical protein
MQMSAYDTLLPDPRHPGKVFNPFDDLKKSVFLSLLANEEDPMDVLRNDGWKRPSL